MGEVVITPIYTEFGSRSRVEAEHIHAEDDHVPMRMVHDRRSHRGLDELSDPTIARFTEYKCRRDDCPVRLTSTMYHKMRLPELQGLVIEHENGRVEMYGDVPDDWRTNERQIITS